MERVIRLSLLFFLQICSLVGATDGPKLTFAAIGDFGGVPQPPYFTYTQKKIARVMGKASAISRLLHNGFLSKYIAFTIAVPFTAGRLYSFISI